MTAEVKKIVSNKGFTVIEIITVIVILGVIGVIAYPKMEAYFRSIRISQGVKVLGSDIEYARNYARTHSDTVWVVFDVSGNSYSVLAGEDEASRAIIPHPQGAGDFDVAFGTGDNIDLVLNSTTLTSNTLVFDKRGMTPEGGTITLNTDRTVTVEEETGYVSIIQ